MAALEGNWEVEVEEEEESRSPSVGEGAMVFVSDILEGFGVTRQITLDFERMIVKTTFGAANGGQRA